MPSKSKTAQISPRFSPKVPPLVPLALVVAAAGPKPIKAKAPTTAAPVPPKSSLESSASSLSPSSSPPLPSAEDSSSPVLVGPWAIWFANCSNSARFFEPLFSQRFWTGAVIWLEAAAYVLAIWSLVSMDLPLSNTVVWFIFLSSYISYRWWPLASLDTQQPFSSLPSTTCVTTLWPFASGSP